MGSTNNGNGFKPGAPRPPGSGRKKGTPNKDTQKLVEVLRELNVNPVRAVCELMPKLEYAKQADVYLKLMEYIYPKRRAEDAAGDPGDAPIAGAAVVFTLEETQALISAARGVK